MIDIYLSKQKLISKLDESIKFKKYKNGYILACPDSAIPARVNVQH
jgi:hypothetical protein